jgi:hypothetical protein
MRKIKSIYWRIPISIALYTAAVAFQGFTQSSSYICCRGYRPDKPQFNGYLLSYDDPICHEPPLIDARVTTATNRNGRLAKNAEEHHAGITAVPGEVVRVIVWFHNSGSEEKRSETTARGVRVGSIFGKEPSSRHSIAAIISADNAEAIRSASFGGDAIVSTATPTILQYVPGSAGACVQTGDAFERGAPAAESCGDYPDRKCRYYMKIEDGVANGSVRLGDLKAGDSYTGYLIFQLKVNSPEIDK